MPNGNQQAPRGTLVNPSDASDPTVITLMTEFASTISAEAARRLGSSQGSKGSRGFNMPSHPGNHLISRFFPVS